MKRKINVIFCIGAMLLLTACQKEPKDSEYVSEILNKQSYIEISMGEAYHQEKVLLDLKEDKAVIPESARWGRLGFREEEEAGTYYGPEEGGEEYETDMQITPEFYAESYFDSIRNLELKVSDVKNENYIVKVVKKSQLKPFAAELVKLSNVVVKNNYKLTGVEIEFDKQCRPVRKIFQLQEIDQNELIKENESMECTQEFSYDMGEIRFENALEKVKGYLND